MKKESKPRLLYLLKLLYERTDEEHPLPTTEIAQILDCEYGIYTYRTTISSDIAQLREYGFDVCETSIGSRKYYSANDRMLDLPELKLLIDAVASAKFITAKKSAELIAKLTRFASQNRADELRRNLYAEDRAKHANEQIYYIVDALNEAINRGKKVAFRYFRYDSLKRRQPRNSGKPYVFSPYVLIWNGDYYYVVGHSDKHDKIVSYRLDRILSRPEILDEDAVPAPEGFSGADFARTMVHMFSSGVDTVELLCDNELMDAIIDRFGLDVQTRKYDATHFVAEVNTAVSHVLYSWIFGFGSRVKILAPDYVRRQYTDMLADAYENADKFFS